MASTWQERIEAAETLDALCAVLNAAVDAGVDLDREPGVDVAMLATYGGDEPKSVPAHVTGPWSWDAGRVLVFGVNGNRWGIVARD